MYLFKPNVAKLARRHDIDALIELLHHKNSKVRSDAADALVEVGPSAVGPLCAVLESSTDVSVPWILEKIGDPQAIEPLCRALARIRWNSPHAYSLASALRKIGLPENPPCRLLCALATGDWKAVQSFGGMAVEPLLWVLSHPGGIGFGIDTATEIIKLLGELRDPRAVPQLRYIVQTTNNHWFFGEDCRAEAAEALGKIRDAARHQSHARARGTNQGRRER